MKALKYSAHRTERVMAACPPDYELIRHWANAWGDDKSWINYRAYA